jgi:hypothetical protein
MLIDHDFDWDPERHASAAARGREIVIIERCGRFSYVVVALAIVALIVSVASRLSRIRRPNALPVIRRAGIQLLEDRLMVGTHDTTTGRAQSQPQVEGKPVVLVPYYSAVEKECDHALRSLEHWGITVRRASFSAIDLLRSVMLSQALEAGFDRFLFIDSDVGFDPNDAIRLLSRPEPVVAALYMKKDGRDFSGTFTADVQRVVFGPAAPGLYPLLYASAGFLRIHAQVLHDLIERLALPRCHFGSIKSIYPFFLPMCVPDGRGGTRYLTEDYSFSHRLGQIGITPLADTSIRLTHYGKYGFSYDDLSPRAKFDNYTIDITYPEGEDRP